ncbi:MAG: hypothetical protein GW903_04465 [Alphaproteobacteria bacterium]|nr:hypothetical protein [Alphaproteobacteria bacterium]NCQ88223.1 hypothetical protein [Alphaproteobacteria bacterium]NCT05270.1 hypothetical protein [Alphaproteobacteria bacterium]
MPKDTVTECIATSVDPTAGFVRVASTALDPEHLKRLAERPFPSIAKTPAAPIIVQKARTFIKG